MRIRNFQSLRTADVELGRFTVIVGASSSGKSSFIRAIRTLASNVRGAAFVTHGQKTASISATGDGWTATLERSATTGTYRLNLPGDDELVFTKLGGAVPEQVTQTLRINPVKDGTSINFAGQFDRPFLLDDSGAQVARTLGELTNVNLIFEAAREANRRRLATNGELKTRQADLARLLSTVQTFSGLSAQLVGVETAEKLLIEAEHGEGQCSRLRELIQTVETGDVAVAQAHRDLAAVAVPDSTELESVYSRLRSFQQVVREWVSANKEMVTQMEIVSAATQEEEEAKQNLVDMMIKLGACPVCGAESHSQHLDRVV